MALGTLCTGFGTTIVFGTSAFTGSIYNVSRTGGTRKAIDKTHMGSANSRYEFCPAALVDDGTYELEVEFNPNISAPIDGAAETITITYPLGTQITAAKDVFTGFVTNISQRVPLDDRLTMTMTLKISGKVVRTVAT